jgi:hypothetical protein
VLGDIVYAGISVIDMEDGAREYSKDILDSDPFAFVMVVLRFVRAHQESAMRGTRVRGAYDKQAQGGARIVRWEAVHSHASRTA